MYNEFFKISYKTNLFLLLFLNLKGENKEMSKEENLEYYKLTEEELGAIIIYYMKCNKLSNFSLMAKKEKDGNITLNAFAGIDGNEVLINE